LVSPITGIVPDLVKASGVGAIHIYQARQNLINPEVLAHVRLGETNAALGKGLTDAQAKASCLAEAVEHYSSIFRGDEPHKRAKVSDLGDAAVHPDSLLNFSANQFANRVEWNKQNSRVNWVPARFDEEKPIDWTPAWSLTNERTRWLPTSYCFLRNDSGGEQSFCRGDSNGCASGNTLEEAILQGFLELVERDSMAIFWYNRIARPAVSLESFEDPLLEGSAGYYHHLGRRLVVLDITTDLGIPSFVAVSWSDEGKKLLMGLGSHLDARIAILRAVSETNQMIPIVKSWFASEAQGIDGSRMSDWLRHASIDNQPYLKPTTAPMRIYQDFPRLHSDDLREDVRTCVRIAQQRGLETIVRDLTRDDIGFPAVRVIVPGLRHFRARLGPGRLYDVPPELGWAPRKLNESELNPIPFFL
jgi:ribosomal protein S12 methylthiotransferase accessory factor